MLQPLFLSFLASLALIIDAVKLAIVGEASSPSISTQRTGSEGTHFTGLAE